MNPPAPATQRLLVIDIHEAAMDLVEQWAKEGKLPTFRRLMAEGLSGLLHSDPPLFGPQRWGNLVTGQDADHHGLTEFLQRNPQGGFTGIPFGPRSGLQAPAIWRLLSTRGVPCAVVNAPVAYPEDVPNGCVLQHQMDAFAWRRESDDGWRRRMSTPTELFDEAQIRFGPALPSSHGLDKAELVPRIEAEIARQFQVLAWVLTRQPWRFAITRVTEVADAQHHLWADQLDPDPGNPHRTAILRAYQALDRGLGALLEALGAGVTVMVVSDCGAGPLRAGIQLNTWLGNEGFLRWSTPAPAGAPAPLPQAGNGGVKAMVRRVVPRPVYDAAARLKRMVRPPAEQLAGDGKLDWSGTRAFGVGIQAGIGINLRGRDPEGIVEPGAEFREVCDQITERLLRLVDPETGAPVVERVRPAAELYGPAVAARTADLFIDWKDEDYLPAELEEEPGVVFVTHRQHGKVLPNTGGHRPDGMLVASGPGIPHGRRDQASVFDLVPTCLELLGQPRAPGLRGRSFFA